ncbi:MAG: amidohydrolase family protein [Pseudomonadota bacterium]
MKLLIKNAEILDTATATTRSADALIEHGRIRALGASIEAHDARLLDARGGLLLPGLSDHHLHLFASAAALKSIDCSPERNLDEAGLADRLRAAPGGDWLRGTGYEDRRAGPLDRRRLDEWLPQRPLRIQHASGKMWFLNGAALALLNVDALDDPGVERDRDGKPSGRLFRLDGWLRAALAATPPSLADLSHALARFGVTALTDASPDNDADTARLFAARQASGELRQRLRLMGNEALLAFDTPMLASGELKVLLDEAALPELDVLIERLRAARDAGRRAAFHCVTPTETTFALAALDGAGVLTGDRLEHASRLPLPQLDAIAERELTVVTQPVLIHDRGDRYRRSHEPEQLAQLYRAASHAAQGTALAFASDAPYGSLDPWLGMRAAVTRLTSSGETLGREEAVSPETALRAYLGDPTAPGTPKELRIGGSADLCLLHEPWRVARERLHADLVRATFVDGEQIA